MRRLSNIFSITALHLTYTVIRREWRERYLLISFQGLLKKQWEKIAAGCAQRVKALNYFLDDIYHGQHILKEQLIPESQIICHEAFQPHMLKHTLKGKIYSQISGIDIIRDSEGEFLYLKII